MSLGLAPVLGRALDPAGSRLASSPVEILSTTPRRERAGLRPILSPHTDLIESTAGAFSGRSTTFDGLGPLQSLAGTRSPRRAHDRGTLWVRITLLVVVSGLLLCIVGSSRARYAAEGGASSPTPSNQR
jgi:hypothetical protein